MAAEESGVAAGAAQGEAAGLVEVPQRKPCRSRAPQRIERENSEEAEGGLPLWVRRGGGLGGRGSGAGRRPSGRGGRGSGRGRGGSRHGGDDMDGDAEAEEAQASPAVGPKSGQRGKKCAASALPHAYSEEASGASDEEGGVKSGDSSDDEDGGGRGRGRGKRGRGRGKRGRGKGRGSERGRGRGRGIKEEGADSQATPVGAGAEEGQVTDSGAPRATEVNPQKVPHSPAKGSSPRETKTEQSALQDLMDVDAGARICCNPTAWSNMVLIFQKKPLMK